MKRQWLSTLRGSKSQQEIARLTGISQNHYSWIENGKRTPSIITAKKIAKVLGFDWTEFFKEDKNAG